MRRLSDDALLHAGVSVPHERLVFLFNRQLTEYGDVYTETMG